MKKNLTFLLMITAMLMASVVFSACGEDEPTPDEDEYAELYGYWINTDKSAAISFVENDTYGCSYKFYTKCSDKILCYDGSYNGWHVYFKYISGIEREGVVEISTVTSTRLLLSNTNYLSSVIFNRATEDEFFEFLEDKGSSDTDSDSDTNKYYDDERIIGTWTITVYGEKYQLTFSKNGTLKELVDGVDYSGNIDYTFLKGKLDFEGSSLENNIGWGPYTVTFSGTTKMTLQPYNSSSKYTFTKK